MKGPRLTDVPVPVASHLAKAGILDAEGVRVVTHTPPPVQARSGGPNLLGVSTEPPPVRRQAPPPKPEVIPPPEPPSPAQPPAKPVEPPLEAELSVEVEGAFFEGPPPRRRRKKAPAAPWAEALKMIGVVAVVSLSATAVFLWWSLHREVAPLPPATPPQIQGDATE